MNRALLAVCVVLAALCALQWSTLRRLKGDLAVVDYAVAVRDFDGRRDEIDRVIKWLDDTTPICGAGPANVSGAEDMLISTYLYLRSRTAGVSETDSRQRVVDSRAQRARDR